MQSGFHRLRRLVIATFCTLCMLGATGSAYSVDFDGNGTPDIFARKPDGTLWMYSGGAGPAITKGGQAAGSGWDLFDRIVAPGTWSLDANADLLGRARSYPDRGYDTLFQVPGDGLGDFSRSASLLAPGENPTGWLGTGWEVMDALIAPGDWDGDGSPDLLARSMGGRLIQYHRDATCCPVVGVRQGAFLPFQGWETFDAIIGPGDWNRDGHVDLVARDSKGSLWLFRGNGSGGFLGDPTQLDAGGWETFDAILGPGDWDGDGNPDLLARRPDGVLLLYSGDGVGGIRLGGQRVDDGWQVFDLIVGAMPIPKAAPQALPTTPVPHPKPVLVRFLHTPGPVLTGAPLTVQFRSSAAGVATVAFVRANHTIKAVRINAKVGVNRVRLLAPRVTGRFSLRVSLRRIDGELGTVRTAVRVKARAKS